MNRITIVIFIVLFYKCTPNSGIDPVPTFNLIDAYDTSFALLNRNDNSKVSIDIQGEHLSILNKTNDMVYLYNLKSHTVSDTLQYPHVIYRYPTISVTNKRNFFVFANNRLRLYDDSAKLMYSIRMPRVLSNKHNKNIKYNYEFISYPLSIDTNQCFISNIFPHVDLRKHEDRQLYFQTPRLGLFKIHAPDSISIVDEFCVFPKELQENYYSWGYPFCAYKDEHTFSYIFKNIPRIYEYNIDKHTTESYTIKNLTSNQLPVYPIDSAGVSSYIKKYYVENQYFIKLLYDQKNNRYVLFEALPIKYMNGDGFINTFEDKPVNIIVIKDGKVQKKLYLANMHDQDIRNSFMYNGSLFLFKNIKERNQPIILEKYAI